MLEVIVFLLLVFLPAIVLFVFSFIVWMGKIVPVCINFMNEFYREVFKLLKTAYYSFKEGNDKK